MNSSIAKRQSLMLLDKEDGSPQRTTTEATPASTRKYQSTAYSWPQEGWLVASPCPASPQAHAGGGTEEGGVGQVPEKVMEITISTETMHARCRYELAYHTLFNNHWGFGIWCLSCIIAGMGFFPGHLICGRVPAIVGILSSGSGSEYVAYYLRGRKFQGMGLRKGPARWYVQRTLSRSSIGKVQTVLAGVGVRRSLTSFIFNARSNQV